jgi:hypothetical protein
MPRSREQLMNELNQLNQRWWENQKRMERLLDELDSLMSNHEFVRFCTVLEASAPKEPSKRSAKHRPRTHVH